MGNWYYDGHCHFRTDVMLLSVGYFSPKLKLPRIFTFQSVRYLMYLNAFMPRISHKF